MSDADPDSGAGSARVTVLERAITFDCDGDSLIGIVHDPIKPVTPALAVLFIVGGGQYRVGAHRGFVHLARSLAASGYAAMRFDLRGMGDSEGEARNFLDLQSDMSCAIDALLDAIPTCQGVILFGLCDGATASVLYGSSDTRVRGLILANPWISTQAGVARTRLRHYYANRLGSAEFWRKLLRGKLDLADTARSLWESLGHAFAQHGSVEQTMSDSIASLPDRTFSALQAYPHATLMLLSEGDLTAREFDDAWQRRGGGEQARTVTLERLAGDHTFSHPGVLERVAGYTVRWLARILDQSNSSSGGG